jgi:hypothetical protein
VNIDFCDFWPGFRKTDNFFYKLLRERFDVEICDRPDFLFYGDPGQHVRRLHNCVKIYLCAEEFLPDFRQCDYAFTSRYLDDPRHLRLPLYVPYVTPGQLDKSQEDLGNVLASKTKFCSFVVSNIHPRKTQKRIDFFHRLSKYKKVDSGGLGLNNMGGPIAPGSAAKRDFLRPYKFNIAFENGSTPGYTTEKIVESMAVRTLPIYWGNPRIGEEFNPKSFINYFDYPSEDALIEKIIELDRDDAKYMEYLSQPYFHHNTPNEFCSRERVLNQFEKIFTTPIVPVSTKTGRRLPGRWLAAKMNQAHPLSFGGPDAGGGG